MVEGFAGVGDEMDVGKRERWISTGVVGDPAGYEVGEAFAVDGGGYGEDVLGGCSGYGGEAAGHLDHGGEVGFDLAPAGAGEESDPRLGGIEVVVGGVGFAGDGGQGEFGEGMADKGGVDVAVAVEGLLEGEDDEHFGDALLDPAKTASLPGPKLGGDEPDDGYLELLEVLGEAEVDVGEVDEDGGGGWVLVDGADELAVLAVDEGGVADHLGDAHVGDVFGADDAGLAGGGHLDAAEAGEGGGGQGGAEGVDDGCAVVVSGGFAGGEEDRDGTGGDGDSLAGAKGDSSADHLVGLKANELSWRCVKAGENVEGDALRYLDWLRRLHFPLVKTFAP